MKLVYRAICYLLLATAFLVGFGCTRHPHTSLEKTSERVKPIHVFAKRSETAQYLAGKLNLTLTRAQVHQRIGYPDTKSISAALTEPNDDPKEHIDGYIQEMYFCENGTLVVNYYWLPDRSKAKKLAEQDEMIGYSGPNFIVGELSPMQ